MVAAVVGGLLALWLLRGDTDASDAFSVSAVPHLEDSFDFGRMKAVEIRFADGTAVSVVGSDLVPFMRALIAQDKQRIDLELRPRTLARLER